MIRSYALFVFLFVESVGHIFVRCTKLIEVWTRLLLGGMPVPGSVLCAVSCRLVGCGELKEWTKEGLRCDDYGNVLVLVEFSKFHRFWNG